MIVLFLLSWWKESGKPDHADISVDWTSLQNPVNCNIRFHCLKNIIEKFSQKLSQEFLQVEDKASSQWTFFTALGATQ